MWTDTPASIAARNSQGNNTLQQRAAGPLMLTAGEIDPASFATYLGCEQKCDPCLVAPHSLLSFKFLHILEDKCAFLKHATFTFIAHAISHFCFTLQDVAGGQACAQFNTYPNPTLVLTLFSLFCCTSGGAGGQNGGMSKEDAEIMDAFNSKVGKKDRGQEAVESIAFGRHANIPVKSIVKSIYIRNPLVESYRLGPIREGWGGVKIGNFGRSSFFWRAEILNISAQSHSIGTLLEV